MKTLITNAHLHLKLKSLGNKSKSTLNLKNYSLNSKIQKNPVALDEISQLNDLLKKSFLGPNSNTKQSTNTQMHTTPKSQNKEKVSFELDVLQDLNQYYESKNKKLDEKEVKDSRLKTVIKKLSQSDLVTIGKDENIDKYKIAPHSESATESILNSIFEQGTNAKFMKNIDKIYEHIEMEEINLWEKIGSAKNIYDIEYKEKDLSEIEEEIEYGKVENFHSQDFPNNLIESEGIDANTREDIGDEQQNEIQNLINNLNSIKIKKEESELKEKELKKYNFDVKRYSEFYKKSLDHLNEINSTYIINIPKIEIKKTQLTTKTVMDKNLSTTSIKNSNINYHSKDFFESLLVKDFKETIILNSLNLPNQSIDNVFIKLKPNLYDEITVTNQKTKSEIKKLFPKKNISQFLLDNYQIKSFSTFITIKIFKNTIFNLDRKTMNCITSKIKQIDPDVVTIVYNTKRIAKTKENYGVFVLFANEVNIGTIIVNCGVMNSLQSIDLFVSFFSLVLLENIQLGYLDKLIHFNFIMAKKFNLEFKLSAASNKITTNFVLANLMDAKFQKLQKNLAPAEFDQIFKEDGTLVESKNYHLPNLKFFSMPKLFTKYFRQYFTIAAQLESGQICYKI